jgi:hypothetical protein
LTLAAIDFLSKLFVRRARGAEITPDAAPSLADDGAADSGSLLVFDHIPKTAGTTFRRSYLTVAFPRDQRWILSGGDQNAEDRERFLNLPKERRRRFRIVAGHDAEALRSRLPHARFLTVIRDPVDRAISSYLHAQYHPGNEALWPDVAERQMGLQEYVLKYEPPNMQSSRLLGEGRFDERQIRRRLDERYALVGYTEAFDQFVFLLHVLEGFPLCLYNNRLVRRERETFSPSPEEVAFVRDLNAQDVLLHHVVRSEFERRLDEFPSITRTRLTVYLEALDRFRAATYGDPTESIRLDESVFNGSPAARC